MTIVENIIIAFCVAYTCSHLVSFLMFFLKK